jgi:hypothetical protein
LPTRFAVVFYSSGVRLYGTGWLFSLLRRAALRRSSVFRVLNNISILLPVWAE